MLRRDIPRVLFAGATGTAVSAAQSSPAEATLSYFSRTPAEIDAGVAVSGMQYPPGDVRRYGAVGDGKADDTQAIVSANKVALIVTASGTGHPSGQNTARVFFPAGKFVYRPTARLEIAHAWVGESVESTLILCSTTAYSGEFFRIVGSTEMRDLFLLTDGLSQRGTGVRIAARDPSQFTGQVRMTRVWVQGFAVNVQVDRAYLITFDQVRLERGGIGFYCEPGVTAPGSNAYVTTHVHLNSYYASNSVNIYYRTDIASTNVTFIGGANEGATKRFAIDGSSYSAYFGNIVNLHFIDWYCENQAAAVVIDKGRNVTFDGLYLSNTGGILIGTNVSARFINVRTTSAMDTVFGGNGSQKVSMESCSWPAAGNSTNFANLIMLQTTINGVYYDCSLPTVRKGHGSPEGTVYAPVGTMYLRSDGGPNSTLYVKESGNGDSGWVSK